MLILLLLLKYSVVSVDIVDLTSEDILATPQFQPVAMLQPVQLPVTPGSTNTNKDDGN
jgi:hypothetical protein